jgi:immunity protein, SdpI family
MNAVSQFRTVLPQYRLALCLVAVAFAVTGLCFSHLPDSIPMHWDLHGHPANYMPRWPAAWAMPITAALVIIWLIRQLTPKRTNTIVINSIAGLMCYFCAVSLLTAMHPTESPVPYYFMGVGVFLMAVGNILGKLTWDYFVGLRTPWTVDDPHVWERTHRASGPVYVLGGAAILIASLAHRSPLIPMALLLATCLYPVLHSYIIWHRAGDQ